MRVSTDEFVEHLKSLDSDTVMGRFAAALLQSKMPFSLAIRLLGCSRSAFYQWCRLVKRLSPKYVIRVKELTVALEYANAQGWTPCQTDAQFVQALLAARAAHHNEGTAL